MASDKQHWDWTYAAKIAALRNLPVVSKTALFASLPPVWPANLLPELQAAVARSREKVVVLDDDPTGCQTVYDVPLLTEWSLTSLVSELLRNSNSFYVLINTRSLPASRVRGVMGEAAENLRQASAQTGVPLTVVSRADSTLRGHFPLETDVLEERLGPFDATLLLPYFEAGGRYTVDDVHYVAEGDRLVPAAETPFARDAALGYVSSNLRDYISEKTEGRVRLDRVKSLGISELRRGGPAQVTSWLRGLQGNILGVVNAAAERDLQVFVSGLLAAEQQGGRYLMRTAASFVAARLALPPRPLLTAGSLDLPPGNTSIPSGLVVVGSHVPKTSRQLEHLLARGGVSSHCLKVEALLFEETRPIEVQCAVERVTELLSRPLPVVLYTSRNFVSGADVGDTWRISHLVSEALVSVVRSLSVRPRYLVAKGGITSNDLATRALGVKRAWVRGQLLPGVPVWQLGSETRFPGLAFVVFPGNVGGVESLTETVICLS